MSGLLDELPTDEEIEESPARDKIITARVRLQKENPFFSYLTMGLNLIETEAIDTAGVDFKGNLYYNPKFINSLNKEQCKTLLAHEALHVALLHCSRVGTRKPHTWNISCDIIVNNMLVMNNFDFSGIMRNSIIPKNNSYKLAKTTIDNLDTRPVEEIYDLIEHLVKEKKINIYVDSKGNAYYKDENGEFKQLDTHIHGKAKENETKEEKEAREKSEKEWKKRLAEAYQFSKNQGREPLGVERHIDDLLNSKMNWKEILYRFITSEIPFDYTYQKPSKRSIASGYYIPSIIKDNTITVTIAVDTSGSIGKDELTEFLTEIYAIGRSFSQVKIHLVFWDADFQNAHDLETSTLDELTSIEIKGGGGTDFRTINEYIEKSAPMTKVLIFFTDAFADFPAEEKYKTLWVLCKNHAKESSIPFGECIKISE